MGKRMEKEPVFESHANAFQSLSISENMCFYEILLHFSTNDYQEDVGGAERAKELIVKSPQREFTGILSITWYQKHNFYPP